MKEQDLYINLIPFELSFEKIKIYYSEELKEGYDTIPKKLLDLPSESDEKVSWRLEEFNSSKKIKNVEIEKNNRKHFGALDNVIKKAFCSYFLNQNLIVCNDFIGGLTLLEKIDSRVSSLTRFKKFTVRVFHPKKKYTCYGGNVWCLSIFYEGEKEITKNPLSSYNDHDSIKKVFVKEERIKNIDELTEDEKTSTETKVVVNREFCQKQNLPINFYKTENKYSNFYNEILGFYSKYIKGKNINIEENKNISIFESGFQKISKDQIIHTKRDSNLLIFGGNRTHYNPYYGIKEYGAHQTVVDQYKFFFMFHENDRETANKLYAYLTKGVKGFPGIFRFVGLNMDIDESKTIKFKKENPIEEIGKQLNSLNFDPNIKYLGIYISRIKKDEPDSEKIKIYHKLKKMLLEKDVTSQVIFKDNIANHNFNYYLPNIAVAILAKLGGIPWRLKRPIEHDLIIGVGAFRNKKSQNTYVGTTLTFKNDGKFARFDSSQANTISDISDFLKSTILEISKTVDADDIKRIIIHYYKQMNQTESKTIEETLNNLGLKIPYIVLNITESNTFIPFDISYNGKMPVSGTCIIIISGFYLLCNNERYSNIAGTKIRDYPYPVQIKISKTNKKQLSITDIKSLIDQVYQFSRMYWVSVKQKGKPVTVLYSEKIAKFSSFFDDNILPDSNTTKKTLWFL